TTNASRRRPRGASGCIEFLFDPVRSLQCCGKYRSLQLGSGSIQRGKRYSTEEADGLQLWNKLTETAKRYELIRPRGLSSKNQAPFLTPDRVRFGTPTLITPRLGQGAFRIAVTEAYGRQCAVTNGKVLPALDAAHIKPYGEGGDHVMPNGLLLRKDIHSVFDSGYVTIKDDFTFSVSKKVKEVFNNGEEYLRLEGAPLRLPEIKARLAGY